MDPVATTLETEFGVTIEVTGELAEWTALARLDGVVVDEAQGGSRGEALEVLGNGLAAWDMNGRPPLERLDCDECGEEGHLADNCPYIAAADAIPEDAVLEYIDDAIEAKQDAYGTNPDSDAMTLAATRLIGRSLPAATLRVALEIILTEIDFTEIEDDDDRAYVARLREATDGIEKALGIGGRA